MSGIQRYVDTLRSVIVTIIEGNEVWATLYDVIDALGLPKPDSEDLGKWKYLSKVLTIADDKVVIAAAKQIIENYPSSRGKPSPADVQNLQDALLWIENSGVQKITNVTRYRVAESLESFPFWGRLSIAEFFSPILPAVIKNYSLPKETKEGYLYSYGGITENEAIFSALFSGNLSTAKPERVSTAQFFRKIGITEWPDERLFLFLERIVDPEIQELNLQRKLVIQLNNLLQGEGYEFRQESLVGGAPVYKVRKIGKGVLGLPKYIIFASTGPKPEIVINDALNMDIRIIRYAEQCLIYDQPPTQSDLTWEMLINWWCKAKGTNNAVQDDVRRELGQRLRVSLQSEPERIFFDTYFKLVKPRYGQNLPALLPQVYLHYDPRNQNEREKPILVRQRMDFLMLLRNSTRIVIEIDGIQHYASSDGQASPTYYAEMVAEDRRIRILGYEIYRFGGAEFKNLDQISKIIASFFDDLFCKHGIKPELGG
jgi:very-short-patch-repair endonuclease